MNIKDALKQDYLARCGRKVKFAWADQVAVVDPLTSADLDAVRSGDPSSQLEKVRLVIRKYRDEAGNPLFGKTDEIALMSNAASDRLAELVLALFDGLPSPEESALAASDPPSSSASG